MIDIHFRLKERDLLFRIILDLDHGKVGIEEGDGDMWVSMSMKKIVSSKSEYKRKTQNGELGNSKCIEVANRDSLRV